MLNSIYISWIIRRRRQKRRSWKKSLKMAADQSGQRRSSVKDGKISHFRWYSNNLINFYCHTLYVQYTVFCISNTTCFCHCNCNIHKPKSYQAWILFRNKLYTVRWQTWNPMWGTNFKRWQNLQPTTNFIKRKILYATMLILWFVALRCSLITGRL